MTTNTPLAVTILEPQFPMTAVQIFDTPAAGSGGGGLGPAVPDTTNLLMGDGAGGTADSGIPAANLLDLVYRKDINSIDGSVPPGLANVPVGELKLGTMILISTGRMAFLVSGPANPADPGQVTPVDFNLSTNNKHWQQVA